MRDFQGFEVSAKKKFCKKFWPRPKIPFFKLGGLRSLANSRLRGTVFPRRQPKISTFRGLFRHPKIWINNTGSLYRSSQEAFSIIIPLRKKNFRAKTVSVNLQKSTAVKLQHFFLLSDVTLSTLAGGECYYSAVLRKNIVEKLIFDPFFWPFFQKSEKVPKSSIIIPLKKR